MSSLNKPCIISCDSYSDPNLKNGINGGVFGSFTNQLVTPLLGVKSVQLTRANFVNPVLQLNDACHLMFFYYRSTTAAGLGVLANLRCVRLYPSNFIPLNNFNFTRNQYFNSVPELITQLNLAAGSSGDSTSFNPIFQAGDITFSYSQFTRLISFTGNTASTFYAPAAADDPIVLAYLRTNAIKMNSIAGELVQPYTLGQSMNARLGFAMSFSNRPAYPSANTQLGLASSTGLPIANGQLIQGDVNPILIGSQNVNVYLNALGPTGQDSRNSKNLLSTIPLEVHSLFVNSYTLSSLKLDYVSVASEIYNLTFEFRDDFGNLLAMPPNYNINLELNVCYK